MVIRPGDDKGAVDVYVLDMSSGVVLIIPALHGNIVALALVQLQSHHNPGHKPRGFLFVFTFGTASFLIYHPQLFLLSQKLPV